MMIGYKYRLSTDWQTDRLIVIWENSPKNVNKSSHKQPKGHGPLMIEGWTYRGWMIINIPTCIACGRKMTINEKHSTDTRKQSGDSWHRVRGGFGASLERFSNIIIVVLPIPNIQDFWINVMKYLDLKIISFPRSAKNSNLVNLVI